MSDRPADLPLSCEIKDYSVLHVWTEVKKANEGEKPVSIRPEIHVAMGKHDYKVFILCNYEIDNFKFECAIEGSFKFGEPLSNSNVGNAWTNACTMLYGIMRGLFSNAVSQAIHKSYYLPSVMMANFVNRRIEELKNQAPKVTDNKALADKTLDK
jgi:hypothetical protein